MENDLLIQGAMKSGFALEHQTATIFAKLGFSVSQSELFPPPTKSSNQIENMVEVDVLAKKINSDRLEQNLFLVECKGTSSENVLLLTEATGNHHSFSRFQFAKKQVLFKSRMNFLSDQRSGPYFTTTGDFFHKKNQEWKPIARQEDKSNLFKGVQQLTQATDAIFNRLCTTGDYNVEGEVNFTPLIVTNAEIKVVRYSDSNTEPPQVIDAPWTVHRNPLVFPEYYDIAMATWHSDNPGENDSLKSVKRLPYLWIVSVNELESFLESAPKVYDQKPKKKIGSP